MKYILLAIQLILSLKLLTSAFTHALGQGQPALQQSIARRGRSARPLLYLSAGLMLLTAVALALPVVLTSLGWLSPWAGGAAAVLMLVSAGLHLSCREQPKLWVSAILFALALVLTAGRLGLLGWIVGSQF